MFPTGDLNLLARRKALLRARIGLARLQIRAQAHRLAQPLSTIDRAAAYWRRISPWVKLAAVPVGFMAQRSAIRRVGGMRRILRWAPAVFQAWRMFRNGGAAPAPGRHGSRW